jgi:FKBP-type peptidyl-prolyl cis-trans isomerase
LYRFLCLALAGFTAAASAQDAAPKSAIPDDKDPVTTASGLKYSILQAGAPDAGKPVLGDRVKVHYTGWLEDGKEFDSSRGRGEPAMFALGAVIPGWNEGVALLTPGTRAKLTIPAALGYGERGAGGVIPPNANLIFDVELLGFEKGPAFAALQADKVQTTASGLKYEITEAGTGDDLTEADRVDLHYGVWTLSGTLVMNHFFEQGPLRLAIGDMRMAFMKELVLKLKGGGTCRAEVPVATAFGERKPPALGDDKDCAWLFRVVTVFRPQPVPAFTPSAPDKLTKTASGLQYEVIKEGTGSAPRATDRVQVHYAGWLEDGKVFDSSYGRGEPAEFRLDQVIAGWTEGMQLMKEGGTYQFVIPANLGYGEAGSPPAIPANATLVFRIELLKVN